MQLLTKNANIKILGDRSKVTWCMSQLNCSIAQCQCNDLPRPGFLPLWLMSLYILFDHKYLFRKNKVFVTMTPQYLFAAEEVIWNLGELLFFLLQTIPSLITYNCFPFNVFFPPFGNDCCAASVNLYQEYLGLGSPLGKIISSFILLTCKNYSFLKTCIVS